MQGSSTPGTSLETSLQLLELFIFSKFLLIGKRVFFVHYWHYYLKNVEVSNQTWYLWRFENSWNWFFQILVVIKIKITIKKKKNFYCDLAFVERFKIFVFLFTLLIFFIDCYYFDYRTWRLFNRIFTKCYQMLNMFSLKRQKIKR